MTIPVSTAPAVKAYLFNALAARSELAAPVLVSYDEPGPNEPDDIIVVGDVVRQLSIVGMVGSGGAGWIGENYTIDVIVDCFRGGDFAQTVSERAAALADVVVDVVRLDPSCGGRVIQAYPSSTEQNGAWDEEHKGRGSRVLLTIAVSAHI